MLHINSIVFLASASNTSVMGPANVQNLKLVRCTSYPLGSLSLRQRDALLKLAVSATISSASSSSFPSHLLPQYYPAELTFHLQQDLATILKTCLENDLVPYVADSHGTVS